MIMAQAFSLHRISSTLQLAAALAWARFKSQNEGSYLGVMWYLLDPLLLFGVILIARGAAFPAAPIENFPVYLLIGLLHLHLFTKVTTDAIEFVRHNHQIITNMQVPYEALLTANVLQRLLMHIFEVIVLVIVMAVAGGSFLGLLAYPIVLGFYALVLTGASFILAPIGAYIRDIGNLWTPFTRLLLFATPIFYAVSPDYLTYKINLANPIFHYMSATRSFIINGEMPERAIVIGVIGFPVVAGAIGFWLFRQTKHRLAEQI